MFLVWLFSNCNAADFSWYEGLRKDCLELLQNENLELDFWVSSKNDNYLSPNDWLTWVDFWINSNLVNEELDETNKITNFFSFDTYLYWNKTNLAKSNNELFLDNYTEKYFYEKELNFVDIYNEANKEFLACSYSKNTSLVSNISNDNIFLNEFYYDDYDVTEITYNGNKWKKIVAKNNFKDLEWKKDVFKVEKVYFVPYKESLDSYYNLYDISSIYLEKLEFVKQKLEEISKDSSNIDKVYSDDDIAITKYNIQNWEVTDEYGLRYIFINWIISISDFEGFLSYYVFEYLLNKWSSLMYNLYLLDYVEDNERELLSHIIFWSRYDLGLVKNLSMDSIKANNYYLSTAQFVKRNYYKVKDIISREKLYYYFYNNINTESNEVFIADIKDILAEDALYNEVDNYMKDKYISSFDEDYYPEEKFENENIDNKNANNKVINIIIFVFLILLVWFVINSYKKK